MLDGVIRVSLRQFPAPTRCPSTVEILRELPKAFCIGKLHTMIAKIINCRNCKWAGWGTTKTGRREFRSYAECRYLVIAIIPASRGSLMRDMVRPVGVPNYDDVPMNCAAWEKIK